MTAITTPDLSYRPTAASLAITRRDTTASFGSTFSEVRQLRRDKTLMVATTTLVTSIVSVTAVTCVAMLLGVPA